MTGGCALQRHGRLPVPLALANLLQVVFRNRYDGFVFEKQVMLSLGHVPSLQPATWVDTRLLFAAGAVSGGTSLLCAQC